MSNVFSYIRSKWNFSIFDDNIWNELLADVTSAPSLCIFRLHLKTFLFHVYILPIFTSLAARVSAHYVENCADDIRLYPWPISSPVYFRDICSPIVSVPFCSRLRSADNDDMIVPRTRTARYGQRSFRVAAPQVWNMLPPHLKNSNVIREQFKSGLKTWLFVQAYS